MKQPKEPQKMAKKEQKADLIQTSQNMFKDLFARGWSWRDVEHILVKAEEELQEVRQAVAKQDMENLHHEIGDVMGMMVTLAEYTGIHAHTALEDLNTRITNRTNHVFQRCEEEGHDIFTCDAKYPRQYWKEAKELEKQETAQT